MTGEVHPPLNFTVMERLDYYDYRPKEMDAYLSNYGYHFSKKMCDWAVGNMRDRNGRKVQLKTLEQVDAILRAYGIALENDKGYDKVFVMHMALSDYFGSSIVDEQRLALYVRDVLDDKDGYPGIAFCRFVADCNGKGVPIIWEDMI